MEARKQSIEKRNGVQVSSCEVEKLYSFLLERDLNRVFDYRVLCRAAELTYGDPRLQMKLDDILEELKSKGHICWYISTGKTYWIQR